MYLFLSSHAAARSVIDRLDLVISERDHGVLALVGVGIRTDLVELGLLGGGERSSMADDEEEPAAGG